MKINDFLENFSDDDFPSDVGMEIKFDRFDPQFTSSELKQMEKAGIIKVNWNKEFFQLTLKARQRKGTENENIRND